MDRIKNIQIEDPCAVKMNLSALLRGVTVDILRNDGRIHPAIVSSVNTTLRSVTVEWSEGGDVKGKELSFQDIFEFNKHLLSMDELTLLEEQKVTKSKRLGSQCPNRQILPPRASMLKNVVAPLGVTSSSSACYKFEPCTDRLRLRKLSNANKRTRLKSLSFSEDLGRTAKETCETRTSVSVIEEIRYKNLTEKNVNRKVKDKYTPILDIRTPNCQFDGMIREYREKLKFMPLVVSDIVGKNQITVCIRKRPLSKKEINMKEIDVVTIPSEDIVIIHEPKYKVDLTKYLENQQFKFDFVFDESCSNETVYKMTAKPLLNTVFNGGTATCFAYGQTGSGKTYTMSGIYGMVATDVFEYFQFHKYKFLDLIVTASFFEIYDGKVFDLLANKNKLRVLEDGSQRIQIVGLTNKVVRKPVELVTLIQEGGNARTSAKTTSNINSSRSHAVFQLCLRFSRSQQIYGKLSLIDLAGNERGADRSCSGKTIRHEGAEINKSLLALKECIRALARKGSHLPFRGSTLTQVLRDSFIGDNSATCMLAMISPGISSCEHSLNTLRYAARVKDLIPVSRNTSNLSNQHELDYSTLQSSNEDNLNQPSRLDHSMKLQDVLDGFGKWRSGRAEWEAREIDLLEGKENLDRGLFASQLHIIIKEQKESLNQLAKTLNVFKKYQYLNHL